MTIESRPNWFTKERELSMRKSTGRFFDRLAKAYNDLDNQEGANCTRRVAKRNAKVVEKMEAS